MDQAEAPNKSTFPRPPPHPGSGSGTNGLDLDAPNRNAKKKNRMSSKSDGRLAVLKPHARQAYLELTNGVLRLAAWRV
jgi:hypothetical protein